jgi:hypothetical protein
VDLLEGLEFEADRRRDPFDPQSRSSSDEKFHCLTVHEVETALVNAESLRRLAHVVHRDDRSRRKFRDVPGALEEADRQPGRSPRTARNLSAASRRAAPGNFPARRRVRAASGLAVVPSRAAAFTTTSASSFSP